VSRAEHVARAEAAYARYRALQEKIDAFEEVVSGIYKENDRLAARYLENSEESAAWVYRVRCKQRTVQENIIKTEATMAGLYKE
jgi:hypothetical protein